MSVSAGGQLGRGSKRSASLQLSSSLAPGTSRDEVIQQGTHLQTHPRQPQNWTPSPGSRSPGIPSPGLQQAAAAGSSPHGTPRERQQSSSDEDLVSAQEGTPSQEADEEGEHCPFICSHLRDSYRFYFLLGCVLSQGPPSWQKRRAFKWQSHLSEQSSLSRFATGLPAPEPSLNGDLAPEEAVPDVRAYSAQSLGASLGGSGGAPTALTGDTDMNGDMEGDYNSSSGEPDEDVDDEEGMSSGDESDEDSKLLLYICFCKVHAKGLSRLQDAPATTESASLQGSASTLEAFPLCGLPCGVCPS